MRRRWQSRPPLLIGNQGGKALKMASRPFQFWEKNPAAFSRVCPQVRDILSRSLAWDEGRGLSYTPCLLMKPVLRLRLHATQSQPRFPAASNVLALPRRQPHFRSNADSAYNTLHFATQSRVPRGKPLWKPLTTKQAEYLALPRCLILSLYLLSAAPVSWSACSSL